MMIHAADRTVTLTAFVGRPVQEVARLLYADAQTALTGTHHGGDRRVAINLDVPIGHQGAVSRAAALTLGAAEWRGNRFRLLLTVSALDHERWFPTFNGALEAEEVGVGDTRLQLAGTYELPLGALGRASGRAGADKLARASLYSLFVNLVTNTQRALQDTASAWRPADPGEIVREDSDHPLGG